MIWAVDVESHEELKRQLAQCEIDGERMMAEIERLRGAERNYQSAHDLQDEKIERLRTALKPFADIADLVNHTERRDGERVFELPRKPPAVGYFTLVREDFRRAAKALEQKASEECPWCKTVHAGSCGRLISGGQSD